MLLVYIGPYFDPKTAWMFTLLGLGYPYLLMINFLFVLLWLFFWKKYSWLSLGVITLGMVHLDQFYGLGGSGIETEKDDISILTFNTGQLRGVDLKGEAFEYFKDQVKETDIILLQESGKSTTNKIAIDLPGYSLYQSKDVTLAILSKYPILASGLANKVNSSNGCIWIDVSIEGVPTRIYNVHLQSYSITRTASSIIDNPELGDEKTWTDVKSVLRNIRVMSKRRSEQVAMIHEHISGSDNQIVVAGDFNDTPVSNTYRRLKEGLTDTFRSEGRGVGTTYAGKIPLLRIDYIFADANFIIVDHEVVRSPISDHYPVKGVLRIKTD